MRLPRQEELFALIEEVFRDRPHEGAHRLWALVDPDNDRGVTTIDLAPDDDDED